MYAIICRDFIVRIMQIRASICVFDPSLAQVSNCCICYRCQNHLGSRTTNSFGFLLTVMVSTLVSSQLRNIKVHIIASCRIELNFLISLAFARFIQGFVFQSLKESL